MIVFMLLVLGLCMGSFVEATSWRIHEQTKSKKRTIQEKRDLSISQGRSMCAHCRHQLAWYDLVPLLSWVTLAGKCRYCRKSIGWQAPLLELATASLFVLSYVCWPYTLGPCFGVSWLLIAMWMVLIVGFVMLSVYDLRWMLLPDRIVYPMQVLAGVYAGLQIWALGTGIRGVVSALLGVLILAGLFWGLYQVSRGAWIGGGDVKLAVVLGLVVGTPLKAGLVLFLSSLLGSVVGVPAMIVGKQGRNTKIPFGPFLMVATIVIVLFGTSAVDWYTRQFMTF